METLEGYRMGVYKTEISQRIPYVEALIVGQTVRELALNSEASREISGFCKEIMG